MWLLFFSSLLCLGDSVDRRREWHNGDTNERESLTLKKVMNRRWLPTHRHCQLCLLSPVQKLCCLWLNCGKRVSSFPPSQSVCYPKGYSQAWNSTEVHLKLFYAWSNKIFYVQNISHVHVMETWVSVHRMSTVSSRKVILKLVRVRYDFEIIWRIPFY